MVWLDKILKATEDSESPVQYIYWAGLSAISAACRRNVYLDRFFYKLYPNIFVMLVGRSGLRKGFPISLSKKLAEEAGNVRVISGRNSIQGVIKSLSTVKSLSNGGIQKDAIGFLVSGEFASFLIQDPTALTIMTDLYDSHANDKWENTLKVSGVESLNNVYLTMLGASNEVHFKDCVPNNAVGGGFIARTFVVYADKKRRINDLLDRPEDSISYKDLSEYLKEISCLSGSFSFAPEGKKLYRDWYKSFCEKNDRNNKSDSTGTTERFHDQVLKAAMLISLSRKLDMVIEEDDISEALERCTECVTGMKKVIMGTGKSQFAPQTTIILKELIAKSDHQESRRKILQKFWGEMDSIDLDRIIETLVQAGAVEAFRHGKDIVYKMPDKIVEQYDKFLEE